MAPSWARSRASTAARSAGVAAAGLLQVGGACSAAVAPGRAWWKISSSFMSHLGCQASLGLHAFNARTGAVSVQEFRARSEERRQVSAPRPSSRRSQARAKAQCRSALLAGDPEDRGRLLDRQPGEEAQLDQPGLLRVVARRAGPGPRPGRAGPSPAPVGDQERRGRGPRAADRRRASRVCLRRAFSTRMRRMASAAAAKKWPRPSQAGAGPVPTSRR